MTVVLHDPDFTLHHGAVRDILPTLPADSVDCVVTSPPYWGLRDYGVSGQLGLEPTPDEYVAGMVAVFREVRRVLRPHGTCWINIGDSYVSGQGGRQSSAGELPPVHREDRIAPGPRPELPNPPAGWAERQMTRRMYMPAATGLKPKDLVGIPWMLAFALRADGWYLRSEIIWAKPNPMPESVTDRPTKAHEQIFLLSKQPRYWYDAEAIREPAEYGRSEWNGDQWSASKGIRGGYHVRAGDGSGGRNARTVWKIATEPYPDAHFATFPTELARRAILAGCPEQVCGTCGKARERIVEEEPEYADAKAALRAKRTGMRNNDLAAFGLSQGTGAANPSISRSAVTVGWSDCGHGNYQPGVVLDPFLGSGTVAWVARHHGRRSVAVELSADYCDLAARRMQQLSLLAGNERGTGGGRIPR